MVGGVWLRLSTMTDVAGLVPLAPPLDPAQTFTT